MFSKYVDFMAISLKFDIFDNVGSVKRQTRKSFGRYVKKVNVINNHIP